MRTFTLAEASQTDLSDLVSYSEAGEVIALTRNGSTVAEIVPAAEMAQLRRTRKLLHDATLTLGRMATDSGARTELDDVISSFGLDRNELEAELNDELSER
ncbi:hypothetical protein VVR26_05505 [Corynebacterium camporealensis]|uniref:type II toxin-antitoxin system Phd/YefM family antitoxin n=1 Tax=Corynebacterium camporealensis TaxID=161896 RepID=UPI0034CF7431